MRRRSCFNGRPPARGGSYYCSPLFRNWSRVFRLFPTVFTVLRCFRCSRAPGLTAERVACSSRSGVCLVVLSWSDKEAAPNPSNYHSPNGIISAWTAAAVATSVPCPTPTPNLPHGCNVLGESWADLHQCLELFVLSAVLFVCNPAALDHEFAAKIDPSFLRLGSSGRRRRLRPWRGSSRTRSKGS